MPVESQAQRGYLNAKFGHAWVKEHHFDQKGKLPYHVRTRMAAGGYIPPIFGAVASKPYQAMPPASPAPMFGPSAPGQPGYAPSTGTPATPMDAPSRPPPVPGGQWGPAPPPYQAMPPSPYGPPMAIRSAPDVRPSWGPVAPVHSAPDVRPGYQPGPIQAHTMPAIGRPQYPGPPRFPTPDGRDGYQGANRLRKLATGRPGAIAGRPGGGFNSYYMPRGFQGSSPMRRPMAKGGVVHGAVIPASYHMNEGGGPIPPFMPTKKKGFHWRP